MRSALSLYYWKIMGWLRRWGMSIVFSPLLGPLCIIRAVLHLIRYNGLPRWRIRSDGQCFISPFACFVQPNNIHLGKGVGLAQQCYVWAGENAKIDIGDNTLIGPGVMIVAKNHSHGDSSTPLRLQGWKEASIHIGKNVWIGANAVILKGVCIGDDAVIGAGAVVTKDVPNGAVMIGVSAKQKELK